ncbi:hypothetical protein FOH10_30215 [Nocardia otitidiscaviarum]|uniref:Winged helix-turn helix domain-containing protein n=1 Tax=Nocardia otitidiscaviarum TaxID=1823 RepID=A0A516NY91_9NOCA|nr:hypothetical protein FOH10_30215 [Nocardia otitidiscaviarum]
MAWVPGVPAGVWVRRRSCRRRRSRRWSCSRRSSWSWVGVVDPAQGRCVRTSAVRGVLHRTGYGKVLRRVGFTFQRPDRRAIEADPAAMEQWVAATYPALRTRAKREGAVIAFGDQIGVRSDRLAGRTWSRRGVKPVARTGKRFSLNAMSTISTHGDLHFTIVRAGPTPGRSSSS